MKHFPEKEKTFTEADGTEWIKKYEHRKVLGIDTGLVGKERWFRISDIDPNRFVLKAMFFGWAGAHKFLLSEIRTGVFYLLTCGCAGILPALDILSCLTGNASCSEIVSSESGETLWREQLYLRKPENKTLAVAGIVVSILVSLLMLQVVYAGVFRSLGKLLTAAVTAASGGSVIDTPL